MTKRMIQVVETRVHKYNPFKKDQRHDEWCELDPQCDTLEKIMDHDELGLEDGEYDVDDLSPNDLPDVTFEFSIVEVDE